MRHLIELQNRIAPPKPWRWPLTVLACLLSGMVWSALTFLIKSQSIRYTIAELARNRFWMTVLFLGLAVLTLVFLTHSLFAGNLIAGLAVEALAFANYFKELITMTPLFLGDFALIRQAGQIASLNSASLTLRRNSVLAILTGAVWLIVCLLLSRPLRVNWEVSAMLCAPLCVLAFYGLFWVGADTVVFPSMGAEIGRAMSQTAANRACGVPLGLWRSLYGSRHKTVVEDYSLEYMEQAVAQAEDHVGGNRAGERKHPHIILILSESFFDITKLEGLSFPDDPLKEFHSLQQEGVSGSFGTIGFGYGTCNVELEVFTGINSGLVNGGDLYSWPAERFDRLPAVPELLRNNGYYTSMLHMYDDSVYDRKTLFAGLGFDDMYFKSDYAQIYPPVAEAEDYWGYLTGRLSGGFLSDELMTELLIAQYEAKTAAGDQPLFLYASSMENHTPYPIGKYKPEQITVEPVSDLTGEAAEHILSCSQGLNNASEALGELVDYFREQEEPVVIVFYGDHLAGMGLSTGGSPYSALGLAPWDREEWDLDDFSRLHVTDYLIWSNDPEYLPGAPGSRYDTSCSYLGARLLELAGVDMPLYWRLIDKLSLTRVTDTAEYHLSRDGELSADLPDQGPDALGLSLLKDFLDDAIYGKQYVTERIGRLDLE